MQPRNHTHTRTCVVDVAGNVTVINLALVVHFPFVLKKVCLEGIPIFHFFFAEGTSHRVLVVVAACNARTYCFNSWPIECVTKAVGACILANNFKKKECHIFRVSQMTKCWVKADENDGCVPLCKWYSTLSLNIAPQWHFHSFSRLIRASSSWDVENSFSRFAFRAYKETTTHRQSRTAGWFRGFVNFKKQFSFWEIHFVKITIIPVIGCAKNSFQN